jgi:hypothetical protein
MAPIEGMSTLVEDVFEPMNISPAIDGVAGTPISVASSNQSLEFPLFGRVALPKSVVM